MTTILYFFDFRLLMVALREVCHSAPLSELLRSALPFPAAGFSSVPPPPSLKDYFQYFTPFIVTALLPTAISSQWRKIDSHRLTRDEQTWLSTTYVQIYAFLQVKLSAHTHTVVSNPCSTPCHVFSCDSTPGLLWV